MFSACVVIPVYNHEDAVGTVVADVLAQNVPCILVNDGSRDSCRRVLESLAQQPGISLVNLAQNGGKGTAVVAGLREAQRQGFTHAIQVDADGQHDIKDLQKFLSQAKAYPQHIISGYPRYDASVPKSRLYGRYLTHIWVWINTLSFSIKDSMCGFRSYPLASTLPLVDRLSIGRRMDFDPEILVRLHWEGIPIRWIETKVTYPLDGISHFDVWWDNVLISKMHAKLFFGMLWRFPHLLWRRFSHES